MFFNKPTNNFLQLLNKLNAWKTQNMFSKWFASHVSSKCTKPVLFFLFFVLLSNDKSKFARSNFIQPIAAAAAATKTQWIQSKKNHFLPPKKDLSHFEEKTTKLLVTFLCSLIIHHWMTIVLLQDWFLNLNLLSFIKL